MSGAFAATNDCKIENVKGNSYRFVANRHRSVFPATGKGIILADPIDPKAAAWLKSELQTIELDRYRDPLQFYCVSDQSPYAGMADCSLPCIIANLNS